VPAWCPDDGRGRPVRTRSRRHGRWPEPRPRRLRRADGASEGSYSPRPNNPSVLRRIQGRVRNRTCVRRPTRAADAAAAGAGREPPAVRWRAASASRSSEPGADTRPPAGSRQGASEMAYRGQVVATAGDVVVVPFMREFEQEVTAAFAPGVVRAVMAPLAWLGRGAASTFVTGRRGRAGPWRWGPPRPGARGTAGPPAPAPFPRVRPPLGRGRRGLVVRSEADGASRTTRERRRLPPPAGRQPPAPLLSCSRNHDIRARTGGTRCWSFGD
jgi:hypothetical protein